MLSHISIYNIQAIFHQPGMNVIMLEIVTCNSIVNTDILVNRQYFLSKIPYDRRKKNKKLTYEKH